MATWPHPSAKATAPAFNPHYLERSLCEGAPFFWFVLFNGYNESMKSFCNCNNSFTTYSEYPCAKPACIRNGQPTCKATAVIPLVTVDTTSGITQLANCFVHVTSINTTFYVDDKHRIVTTWAGPVISDDYDYETNSLGLKSQEVWDFTNHRVVRYDKTGANYMVFNADEYGEVTEESE